MLMCGRGPRTLAQASGAGDLAPDPRPPAISLPSKYASAERQTRSGTKTLRGEGAACWRSRSTTWIALMGSQVSWELDLAFILV